MAGNLSGIYRANNRQSEHISGHNVLIIIRFFLIGTVLTPRAGLFSGKARFKKFFIEKF